MRVRGAIAIVLACVAIANVAYADRVADVRNTKHNLSAPSGPLDRDVKAKSETQVCVFCHTPHGASPGVTPLWNRQLSNATYTVYTSSTLDANMIQGSLEQPGGSSKLCLSCHDGTLAIGSVNVLSGSGSSTQQGTRTIDMTITGGGTTMPAGPAGALSGFTRNLGVDLTNDHPVSVTYSSALVARDGELRDIDLNQKGPPGKGTVVGVRATGYKPQLPLEPTAPGGLGQVQCATCHDPHLRETDANKGNQKFLRQNRFQEGFPTTNHDPANDIICLSCHDKNKGEAGSTSGTGAWAYSAHANPLVATQTYMKDAADRREFPVNLPVWKAACMNCHDTHTVQGARRLLREGTDDNSGAGKAALEETCYQCHDGTATVITPATTVPNIKSDFQLARRMPIRSSDQPAGVETHEPGGNFNDTGLVDCSNTTNACGKDLIESREKLGYNTLNNRHAECTDCHNPHRVVKFRDFRGNPVGSISGNPDGAGTHPHTDDANTTHSNVASGVLRGSWGVEPVYTSASFFALPTSYQVKRGDPGAKVDTSVAASYLTREYQICLKCHSDYGYTDDNVYPKGNRPTLGAPGTLSPTNNLTMYTNQAREFQAPISHQGETTASDSGASSLYANNNHRSWHPVMNNTARTPSVRGGLSANNWRFPWRNAVGTQTMYCTDCHGSNVSSSTSVIPDGGENGNPWGPHGSGNNFLLKGQWNNSTGTGQETNGLCFKCHDYGIYTGNNEARTGFWISSDRSSGNDGHKVHRDKIDGNRIRCNWCHVAVPHGWKNKAFLVNLNDVGPEAGQVAGTEMRRNTSTAYNQEPYYMNAMLKVINFKRSGDWVHTDCGSRGGTNGGNGQRGRDWMREGSESCKNPP